MTPNSNVVVSTHPTPSPFLSPSPGPHSLSSPADNLWSEDSTDALLDAWTPHHLAANRGSLRHSDWLSVSTTVNSDPRRRRRRQVHRSDNQCRKRIDTLKKKYRVEKYKADNSAGKYVSPWNYFRRLDYLFAGGGGGRSGGDRESPAISPVFGMVPVGRRTARRKRDGDGGGWSGGGEVVAEEVEGRRGGRWKEVGEVERGCGSSGRRWREEMGRRVGEVVAEDAMEDRGGGSWRDVGEASRWSGSGGGVYRAEAEVEENGGRGWWTGGSRRVGVAGKMEDDGGKGGRGKWREVAEAIRTLGEVYERVEARKQERMVMLEKQRMKFAKDLEFQRLKLLLETQLEIARIKPQEQQKAGQGAKSCAKSCGDEHVRDHDLAELLLAVSKSERLKPVNTSS